MSRSDPAFLSGAGEIPQDWGRLAAHLADQGMTLDTDPAPRQFSSGFGNLNYLISVNGEKRVLRRPPVGPVQPGSNDMARESRILMHLWKAFPLAPRCHHFCEDPSILGAPFFIMEYRRGLVIGGTMPDGLPTDAGRGLGRMLAEQLAAFHAVDSMAVDLDTLGNTDGYLARTLKGWTKRAVAAWNGDAPPALATLADWLDSRPIANAPATLIHNDFKLDNVILNPDTLAPLAVIDWDMGTRGDPRWDLAVMLGYWTEASDPDPMLELDQMPTAGHGFPSREAMANHYAEFSGIDMTGFHFIRVLAVFRAAVIFRQLYIRYVGGDTNDPRFARFGKSADGLLDFAIDIAKEKYF
ncbi:MAG: phosphotransferase family protein [Alphaproteobacteria bacterium]|nr:phosphotransferase family protein [Alphaproteobacteria bacterium]